MIIGIKVEPLLIFNSYTLEYFELRINISTIITENFGFC